MHGVEINLRKTKYHTDPNLARPTYYGCAKRKQKHKSINESDVVAISREFVQSFTHEEAYEVLLHFPPQGQCPQRAHSCTRFCVPSS